MFPSVLSRLDKLMVANLPVIFGRKPLIELKSSITSAQSIKICEEKHVIIGCRWASETMLGHRVHTGVQGNYLDYDYIEEQRDAYALWSNVLGNKSSE